MGRDTPPQPARTRTLKVGEQRVASHVRSYLRGRHHRPIPSTCRSRIRSIGYFHLFRVQHRFEEILGVRVDLATPDGLRRELGDGIFAEAIRAA